MTTTVATEERYTLCRKLHSALVVLIKKNRFIRRLTDTGLSRAEIHTLVEIEARGEASMKVLQPILNMEQSSVSRLVQGLVQKKLLDSNPWSEDRRVRVLQVTTKGHALLTQIDTVAGAVFDRFKARLTTKERESLNWFFCAVSDFYDQPHCPERNGEDELRMQQRRMSRALGVLGKNIFGSKLSSSQWHVFTHICGSPYPLNPKQIAKKQGIPSNSLTTIFDKLIAKGLISREQSTHDSRYIELSATKKGAMFLQRIEDQFVSELQSILSGLGTDDIAELLDILEHYVDQDPDKEQSPLPPTLRVQRLRSKEDRKIARTFAITELVGRGHAHYAPGFFLHADSHCYALYSEDDILCSICEIHSDQKKASLSLLASKKEVTPAQAFAFLCEVLDQYQKSTSVTSLDIDFFPAARLLQKGGRLRTGRSRLEL